jgi:thymidylate synthase (FAD)
MQKVEPKVYLIGEPRIIVDQMREYLEDVGGVAWLDRVWPNSARNTGDTELLTEFMGRLCYKSWIPELNKNVTKIREDHDDYILNVLRSKHGSILEHCYFHFVCRNVSRVLTAELNRHGDGTAISEQSLRYVRLDDIPFWEPPGLSQHTLARGAELVDRFEEFYTEACEIEGLNDPDVDFTFKKTVTSKLRRWAPMGMATEEGWSANVRALRHIIEMRTAFGAEEEIRLVFDQVATIMIERCPALFQDFDQDESIDPPAWVPEFSKV